MLLRCELAVRLLINGLHYSILNSACLEKLVDFEVRTLLRDRLQRCLFQSFNSGCLLYCWISGGKAPRTLEVGLRFAVSTTGIDKLCTSWELILWIKWVSGTNCCYSFLQGSTLSCFNVSCLIDNSNISTLMAFSKDSETLRPWGASNDVLSLKWKIYFSTFSFGW